MLTIKRIGKKIRLIKNMSLQLQIKQINRDYFTRFGILPGNCSSVFSEDILGKRANRSSLRKI